MKYQPPVGGASNDPYVDGSSSTEGSIPPAASIEQPQRELINAISGGGLTPNDSDLTQLLQSIKNMAGARLKTVNANAALTLADAGLVLIDASAGNITLTLPAASTLKSLPFRFKRVDSSANSLTIVPAANDTIGGAANIPAFGNGETAYLVSDGNSDWIIAGGTQSFPAAQASFGTSHTVNGYQRLPNGLILQWGDASASGSFTITGRVTFPIQFPNGTLNVSGSIHDMNSGDLTNVNLFLGQTNTPSDFGFSIFDASGSTSGVSFNWKAIGY